MLIYEKSRFFSAKHFSRSKRISFIAPMQIQNVSADANKIIPDLHSRTQDQLLGPCYLHPEKTSTQIADTANK